MTSLSFLRFMANLYQSRSQSPEAGSVVLAFSSIVTFYRTKNESRTENPLTQLSYCCSKDSIFAEKC